MHKVVFVSKVILGGTCTKIAVFININPEIVCDKSPYSDIKFSIIVQKWLLNILLHNPKWVLLIFLKDKFRDVSHVLENFYTSSLIERSWLYQPHVAGAVFHRNSLIFWATSWNFSEAVHKPIDFMIIYVASNHIGSWSCVKYTIFSIDSCLIIFIISGKWFDQHCLGAYSSVDF